MRLMRIGMALAVCGLLVGDRAAGDEILLKNGHVITGKIEQEDAEEVTIRVRTPSTAEGGDKEQYIKMTFAKENVRRITRDGSFFEPITRTATQDEEEEAEEPTAPVPAVPAADEETEPAVEEPTAEAEESKAAAEAKEDELDPALKAQIESLIGSIEATEEQEARERLEQRLVAIGKDAVPLVVTALKAGGSDLKRISLIRVLRTLGDKRAVQELVNQMRGGRRNQTRMRYAWYAVRTLTGKGFDYDYDEDNTQKRNRQLNVWQKWFDSVKDDYPPQIGYDEEAAGGEKPAAAEPAPGQPADGPPGW